MDSDYLFRNFQQRAAFVQGLPYEQIPNSEIAAACARHKIPLQKCEQIACEHKLMPRLDKKPGHHVVAFAFVLLPNRVSV
jgi:hypothetical protein